MSATRYALVRLAALDLRRRGNHRSELRSQLLLGEIVRLLRGDRAGAWFLVENLADGYRGWVRGWGLIAVEAARARAWRRRATARVGHLYAEARTEPGRGALVTPLVWSARVIPLGRRGRFRRVALPDGRSGWVEAAALAGPRERPSLVDRVRSLLGVPYLWGGKTAIGIDCSGFTQLVLGEQGIALPRDAADQERRSRSLRAAMQAKAGDLIFFGRRGSAAGHVGLMLGGRYFAHARGCVRVSSLDPGNPLCDRPLLGQVREIRRPARRRGEPAI